MPEFNSAPATTPGAGTAETLTSRVVDEVVTREPARSTQPARKRRVWLPLSLFLATCLSTFWVGCYQWFPMLISWTQGQWPESDLLGRQMIMAHWQDGLIYMACLLGILLAHEFGHFFATVYYRIPASYPFVIPMPLLPIGTFGAVIGMDGHQADRKQIFDIGLAGPLAGLVVAVPVIAWGTKELNFNEPYYGPYALNFPLLVDYLIAWLKPVGHTPGVGLAVSQLNPYFMAGWVGLMITGLNMMPVSQLDGGHVIHALFGRRDRKSVV